MERDSLLHVEDTWTMEDIIVISTRILLRESSQLKEVLFHKMEVLVLKELLFLPLQKVQIEWEDDI